jgi:hypothetical protein
MSALFSEIYLYLKLQMLLNSNYHSYGLYWVQFKKNYTEIHIPIAGNFYSVDLKTPLCVRNTKTESRHRGPVYTLMWP